MTGNPEAHNYDNGDLTPINPWILSDKELDSYIERMSATLPKEHPQRKEFEDCKAARLAAQVKVP